MNLTFESKFGHAVRILVGAIGGYLFASGLMAMIGAGLPVLGMARSEAVLVAILTGFVALIGVVIWVTATKRFLILSSALIASAALMSVLAPGLVQG